MEPKNGPCEGYCDFQEAMSGFPTIREPSSDVPAVRLAEFEHLQSTLGTPLFMESTP